MLRVYGMEQVRLPTASLKDSRSGSNATLGGSHSTGQWLGVGGGGWRTSICSSRQQCKFVCMQVDVILKVVYILVGAQHMVAFALLQDYALSCKIDITITHVLKRSPSKLSWHAVNTVVSWTATKCPTSSTPLNHFHLMDLYFGVGAPDGRWVFLDEASRLAFYVNLHRAVIGPSATLTGRWQPDIDLRRMLTGVLPFYKLPLWCLGLWCGCSFWWNLRSC